MRLSADSVITHWSAGAADLYGFPEPDALGQHVSVLLGEGSGHDIAERAARLADGAVPPFEALGVTRDGARFTVEIDLSVLRDPDGAVVGTQFRHRNVRFARRQEPSRGGGSHERRASFDDSPVAQSRADIGGRVLAVNAALEWMLGESAAALLGRNALEMYVAEDRPGLERALARLASGAENYVQHEPTLRRSDGRLVRVVRTVTTMRDEHGAKVLAISLQDVTALRAAEERIHLEAGRFDALLTSLPVTVFTYDLDGRCTSSRGKALSVFGIVDDEFVGTDLLEVYTRAPVVRDALLASLAGRSVRAVIDHADRVWECHYNPLRGQSAELVGGIGTALDVTDLTRAEREVRANEARLRGLLRHATDVVLVLDRAGRTLYVSPAVTTHFGYDEVALSWHDGLSFVHPEDRPVMDAAWRRLLHAAGSSEAFEGRVRHADGSWRWCEHALSNLLDDPDVGGIVVNLRDVSERRRAQQELEHTALHDRLTGLANRALLFDRVDQALARDRRRDNRTGLVLLDVLDMSAVNEAVGQAGGDTVLRELAARLVAAVREVDSVARVGGDHFVVLVDDVASMEELRTRGAVLAETLGGSLLIDDVRVDISLRVGTALSPTTSPGALLAAAERVLAGPEAAPRVPASERRAESAAVAELRCAVADGQLRMHLQPVMDIRTDTMAGAEALVRWQHPARGLLPPSAFIGLAERSGLIIELGAWVLREACLQAAAWERAGLTCGVGVNLSPLQMVGDNVVHLVGEVLEDTGASPDRLILEVTESALMDDPRAPDVLQTLREMGVRLALDDFGTGYSSLTYLKRFPLDAIKIDRSFVAGLGRDRDDEAIVASVVSLGRAVGKLVVAEGVETAGQLDALCALGVDQGQGFLWSSALPGAQLDTWLEQRRAMAAPRPAAAASPPVQPQDVDARRIFDLQCDGASLHTIAAALNAEGRRTTPGARWTTTTVARKIAAHVGAPTPDGPSRA